MKETLIKDKIQQVLKLIENKKLNEARIRIEAILETSPDIKELYPIICKLYIQAGMTDIPVEWVEIAIQIEPEIEKWLQEARKKFPITDKNRKSLFSKDETKLLEEISSYYKELALRPEIKEYVAWNFDGERMNPLNCSPYEFDIHITKYLFCKSYIDKNISVIDVGCGCGYSEILLSKWTANILGCDISPDAIALARILNPGIRFEVKSMEDLKKKADVIIAFEVIEHTKNWQEGLRHLVSLCKKHLIFSVPYNQPEGSWKWHNFFGFTEYVIAQYFNNFPRSILLDFYYQDETGYISKHPCVTNTVTIPTSLVVVVTKEKVNGLR
ncbi:MAG: class I SAM-dependent methyltransferase [bacterium]|nr:class I SAM-dependent methyltransferase [bacterium]